jgi:hypothetical protein
VDVRPAIFALFEAIVWAVRTEEEWAEHKG